MLLALRDGDRRVLIFASFMLCGGSLVLLPLAAQSSPGPALEAMQTGSPLAATAPQALRFPVVRVARDPFAPLHPSVDSSAARDDLDGSASIALPPNAGAAPSLPVVRAVVLGPQSRALVEIDGVVQVLGIGDKAGAATILSIDAQGVGLSNGTHIVLTEQHP